MAELSGSNFTNFTEMTAQGDTPNLAQEVGIITIIINGVTCPFTVVLNVLVIMAVKKRRRLQSNTNILLACLAVSDALTGLVVQPSFIVWKSFDLLNYNGIENNVAEGCHKFFLRTLTVCSSLHLVLITWERLMAVKFTMSYPCIVTKRKFKVALITFWSFAFLSEGIKYVSNNVVVRITFNLIVSLVMIFCIVFITASYAILYRESRHLESKIKTQQLPQEEVRRFVKENKALKTTAFVVSAVLLSFLPMAFGLTILSIVVGIKRDLNLNAVFVVLVPLAHTCAVLNSLLNPLIYCLRQKEMRKFVFRAPCKPVEPVMN